VCVCVCVCVNAGCRYLTGSQGRRPSPYFDPLSQLVRSAHGADIQVHAWLNPYRANMRPDWQGLAPGHIANIHRQYAHPYDHYLWMDPGAQVVVDWLLDVVTDIVTRSRFSYIFNMSHRSTTYVDAAYCYRPSSVVCRSVGLSRL